MQHVWSERFPSLARCYSVASFGSIIAFRGVFLLACKIDLNHLLLQLSLALSLQLWKWSCNHRVLGFDFHTEHCY